MNARLLYSLFLGAALLSADTLVLRNGTRVDGSFLGGDNRSLRFAVGSQVSTYYLQDVASLQFNDSTASSNSPATAPAPQNASQGGPPPGNEAVAQSQPSTSYSAPASAPAGGGPMGVEVPSGTDVVVRLIDRVNSDTDRLGQTYRASVDQPVVVNGQTVIPRGADVVATLIDAQKSGKIEGKTVMTLDLKSITVNNHPYDIVTTGVSRASNSRGQRSAKVIGGTAAAGAIIGAIAGGGKGAAIGTLAGAGAGTAAQVATSGQKVNIPAETRLTFTLKNALDL
jgi:hypothetical protein